MEDARFVRFTHDDGTVRYYATYTAYDGAPSASSCSRRRTSSSFTSAPIVGAAAANKGLALFPRRIAGRYAALSRCDRETNTVAFSDDLHAWDRRRALSGADPGVGGPATGQLRLADRDRGRVARRSPTGSGRCAPTASARSSSIWTIRPGSSGSSASRCSARPRTSRTATCRTSSTPAVRSSTRARSSLPYGIGDAAIGFATVPMSELLADARCPGGAMSRCGSPCSLRSPGGHRRATTGRGSSSRRC